MEKCQKEIESWTIFFKSDYFFNGILKNSGLEDLEWVLRNISDETRLDELVELYESLGFEVMIKDYVPEEHSDKCDICMSQSPDKFKVIYTKKITI
jgi:hypothetical protein